MYERNGHETKSSALGPRCSRLLLAFCSRVRCLGRGDLWAIERYLKLGIRRWLRDISTGPKRQSRGNSRSKAHDAREPRAANDAGAQDTARRCSHGFDYGADRRRNAAQPPASSARHLHGASQHRYLGQRCAGLCTERQFHLGRLDAPCGGHSN